MGIILVCCETEDHWVRMRTNTSGSTHPDLHRDHLILPGCYCSPQTESSDVGLQHALGPGILFTDATPLEDIFNKSNLNIDKDLDGVYEPTLFGFKLLNLSTTFCGQ